MPGKKIQKNNSVVETKVDVSTPVVEAKVSEPVVDTSATPVTEKKKRGGAAKKQPVAELVVVPAPTVEAVPQSKQKGGRKKAVVESTPVAAVSQDAGDSKAPVKKQQRKKKEVVETKDSTSVVASVESKEGLDASVDGVSSSGEKQIRSFKVLLPGATDFEGRFTGLTPYQAANKALSKYFREGERTAGEVTFSICESTRKSKKTVYTYVGQRHKLTEPVKYTIQDGREIVKNFKNTLKKVKKADASSTESHTQNAPASL
jgi:hypothetical protein